MNILVFTTAFHPSIGGIEKQTQALIQVFLRKGNKVKMITLHSHTVMLASEEYEKNDIDIYFQPNIFKIFQLFLWCSILFMPNISLKGVWFLFFSPFKRWVVSHNDHYLANKKSIKTKIKLLLTKLASQNIAVSKSVANSIQTKAKIIYNCYDQEIFKIYVGEERVFDFVFLGRLVSQKGCDFLIRACKNLMEPFTLNIIGDGPEKFKLQEMVLNLGLMESIKFLGVLEGEQLARTLNRHETMIIPSIDKEGFGIVVLEGMACGCKIIASNAGGLIEAVNGLGKTFEMGNQQDLECLLKATIKETKQHKRNPLLGMEVSNYLAERSKDTVAQQYLDLFE